ncbi:hypothetical protein Tcan_04353 [Toxocara canis]|uniref:Uncharacterized protein n=1 Tax=Toxocara canis TaxID=6265 RepID=A0A0B2VD06_TOXCA|nr:hypothetical protein Tcan_04353 [Toxocara canis]
MVGLSELETRSFPSLASVLRFADVNRNEEVVYSVDPLSERTKSTITSQKNGALNMLKRSDENLAAARLLGRFEP